MSAADVMAPPMTVAIATGTGAGMTDVTNQIPLRLADPRLATTVEMVVRIAVGTEEAITAVGDGEMTHPETGKNRRQAPQTASALEGRGRRMCRRKTRPHRSSSRPCGTAGGDGLHCPVPLIRRCSCSSRTAAVRAGDGPPGDPVRGCDRTRSAGPAVAGYFSHQFRNVSTNSVPPPTTLRHAVRAPPPHVAVP